VITVDEARARVLALLGRLPGAPVPLEHASGLVLAEAVRAGRDLPGFDNSAMDGYAVRAADTADASAEHPASLWVRGEIAAGTAEPGALKPGEALRIMTGAPIPRGADAVVEVEATEAGGDRVRVRRAVSPGESLRHAGGDIRGGELALEAGTWLGPAQLALLAALGETFPRCHPRPRVAVIATGDELVDPDTVPGPGQVTDIVTTAVAAAVNGCGGITVPVRRAADTEADVRRAFADAAAAHADLVVSVGGVSMGVYDHVRKVIETDGEIDFWRVAMRPGKPLAVGRVGGLVVIGLPGNPVSALVGFEVYVVPAILAMSGREGWSRPRVSCDLEAPLDTPLDLRTFIRARVRQAGEGTRPLARPAIGQGSHHLRALAQANALLDIPAGVGALGAGAAVEAILLEAAPGPGWSR
jgi:molybdopterin molybdotransferase